VYTTGGPGLLRLDRAGARMGEFAIPGVKLAFAGPRLLVTADERHLGRGLA
jgi:hypothetical protein